MTLPVTLALGQTAQPDHCGSCRNFRRFSDTADVYGTCQIKLPPWVADRNTVEATVYPDREQGRDWTRVKDTDDCDLHRHTGLTYITSHLVKP